ncbi:protein of unknown function [Maridesulfovibrio hydrothermalis AM13 = DSM 14728]|uniref:Uncharacterized protein n=1 Tax=Maridesulfovibrio hydrothermalis AM13 = DSM 14728 TaxID=1121451 RepID=L0RGM4_9BACT|nr:protein of unknown function [Maridesulfovibrio hydrothermalis AM13 = DSM 14728]
MHLLSRRHMRSVRVKINLNKFAKKRLLLLSRSTDDLKYQ